jgi:hypothetical protein
MKGVELEVCDKLYGCILSIVFVHDPLQLFLCVPGILLCLDYGHVQGSMCTCFYGAYCFYLAWTCPQIL